MQKITWVGLGFLIGNLFRPFNDTPADATLPVIGLLFLVIGLTGYAWDWHRSRQR